VNHAESTGGPFVLKRSFAPCTHTIKSIFRRVRKISKSDY